MEVGVDAITRIPRKSVWRLAQQIGATASTTWKICRDDLFPHKMRPSQPLSEVEQRRHPLLWESTEQYWVLWNSHGTSMNHTFIWMFTLAAQWIQSCLNKIVPYHTPAVPYFAVFVIFLRRESCQTGNFAVCGMATNVTGRNPLQLYSAGALDRCAVLVPELPSSRDWNHFCRNSGQSSEHFYTFFLH
jgi:hypothetical protein